MSNKYERVAEDSISQNKRINQSDFQDQNQSDNDLDQINVNQNQREKVCKQTKILISAEQYFKNNELNLNEPEKNDYNQIKSVDLEGKTQGRLCEKLSEYEIIKYDIEKQELQKFIYLQNSPSKQIKIETIVLRKTFNEIISEKKEEEEGNLQEIVKELVQDATDDQINSFIDKISQLLSDKTNNQKNFIVRLLFGDSVKDRRHYKLIDFLNLTQQEEEFKKKYLSEFYSEQLYMIKVSEDKKQLFIGTNHGRVIVLSTDDFKVEQTLWGDYSKVLNIQDNKRMIFSSHYDGKLIRYKKDDYIPDLFVQSEFEIYYVKISENTNHVYIQGEMDEEDHSELFDSEKKRVVDNLGAPSDYTDEYLFAILKNNKKNLVMINLKTYEKTIKEKLFDKSNICWIKTEKTNKCVIIGSSQLQKVCLLDYQGNKLANIAEHPFSLIYNSYHSKFLKILNQDLIPIYVVNQLKEGLPLSQYQLIQQNESFDVGVNQDGVAQLFLFNQQSIYYDGNKYPILSDDQKYIAFVSGQQRKYQTRIVDIKTNQTIKTIDNFELIGFDKDNHKVYGNSQRDFVKINLKDDSSVIIYDGQITSIQFNYSNDTIYFPEYSQVLMYDFVQIQKRRRVDFNGNVKDIKLIKENILVLSKQQFATCNLNLEILKIFNHKLLNPLILNITNDGSYAAFGSEDSSVLEIVQIETDKQTTIEAHKYNKANCFFIEKNKAVSIANDKELFYWDTSDMQNWQKLFSIEEENIKTICNSYGELKGLVINNRVLLLSYALHELCNDFSKIECQDQQTEWISGPFPSHLFLKSIQYFQELPESEEKTKLAKSLANNVIQPYGFTFLQFLVLHNFKDQIDEVLRQQNFKFIRDVLGNSPLTYAIQNVRFQIINSMIQNMQNENQPLICMIKQQELIDLCNLSPEKLPELLKNATQTVVSKKKYGQIKDEDQQTYVKINLPFIKGEKYQNIFLDELLEKNTEQAIEFPIEVKHSVIPLNLETGSPNSLSLLKGFYKTQSDQVFKTDLVKMVVDKKWQSIFIIRNFYLSLQILQTLLLNLHAYYPGKIYIVYANILSSFLYLLQEILIMIRLGFSEKKEGKENIVQKLEKVLGFNSSIVISVALMQLIYCLLLINQFYFIEKMLAIINLISWIKLIMELAQFQIIRKFLRVFLASLQSIPGFIIFFLLILIAFTTTDAIVQKTLTRYKLIQDKTGAYSEDFYIDNHAYFKNEDKTLQIYGSIKTIWKTMMQGEYWAKDSDQVEAKDDLYSLFLMMIFTALPNVIFLNLIVAILSDSYEETMSSIDEKCLRDQVYMLLKYEALSFSIFSSPKEQCYVWIEQVGQTVDLWVCQVDQITQRLQKSCDKIYKQNQDQRTEFKNQLDDMQSKQNKKFEDLKSQQTKMQAEMQTQQAEMKEQLTQIFAHLKESSVKKEIE